MNTAYFVKRPRIMAALRIPHLLSEEKPYTIAKEIALPAIDY